MIRSTRTERTAPTKWPTRISARWTGLAVVLAVMAAGGLASVAAHCGSCGAGGGSAATSGHGHDGHDHAVCEGHSHEMSTLHGGTVTVEAGRHFETLFSPDGIRVYAYEANQVPTMLGGIAEGTAKITYTNGKQQIVPLKRTEPGENETIVYFCPGHPQATQTEPGICKACGTMQLLEQVHLYGDVDLSAGSVKGLEAVIEVSGLRGTDAPVRYSVAADELAMAAKDASAAGGHDHGDHHHGGHGHGAHDH